MISSSLSSTHPVIQDATKDASIANVANPLNDDSEMENVNATTVHIMQNELKRVQKYVQMQQVNTESSTAEQYEFSENFTTEMTKYGKMKKKKRAKKSPYAKPKEYKNGMSNFLAFTSHFLPYFEGGTNKSFRNLLWDINKGIINTWFEKNGLGKTVAKELGREKYTEQLTHAAPQFKTDYPNIVATLNLFDASLNNDEQRNKILQNQKTETDTSSSCVGATNASMPTD